MMTARIGSAVATKVIQRINAPTGVNAGLVALTLGDNSLASPVDAAQVRAQNVAADLVDRSSAIRYPLVHVYCEKIVNDLSEKFRSFSGRAQMTIEVRHSQDNLNGLQNTVEIYADSIMQMLNAERGDWGDGMFYGGGYEVALGPVKHGGKNFIQAAKITFQIGVSRN
jgi:hypothetical protein